MLMIYKWVNSIITLNGQVAESGIRANNSRIAYGMALHCGFESRPDHIK